MFEDQITEISEMAGDINDDWDRIADSHSERFTELKEEVEGNEDIFIKELIERVDGDGMWPIESANTIIRKITGYNGSIKLKFMRNRTTIQVPMFICPDEVTSNGRTYPQAVYDEMIKKFMNSPTPNLIYLGADKLEGNPMMLSMEGVAGIIKNITSNGLCSIELMDTESGKNVRDCMLEKLKFTVHTSVYANVDNGIVQPGAILAMTALVPKPQKETENDKNEIV